MPKFSIITPQYNSYELMTQFFDSMEGQTYKDFELIIIDDCSNDGSFEKLKERMTHSSLNLRLLRTPQNAGPGNARNLGIEHASGEWITFVDNDDWVDNEFLEKVNQVIERENVNCIICDYNISKGGVITRSNSMYDSKGGVKTLSECISNVRNHTFCKFYKLSAINEIRFPNIKRCEDVAFVCQAIEACKAVYYLPEPLYYYLQRSTSLSNNNSLDEGDMITSFGILENTIGQKYPEEIKEKSVSDLLYGVLLMMCKAGKTNREICNYINSYENKYPKWWECNIIRHLGVFKGVFLKCARFRFIQGLKFLAYIHTKMIS